MIVKNPTFILKRHKSIVNSVASHPTIPMLVTAGVEKTIRLFTSFEIGDDVCDDNDPLTMEDEEVIGYFQALVNYYLNLVE
jgi:WD40 repeat protein